MRRELPNLAQWAFRHHADPEAWSWERYDVKGELVDRSVTFATFGKAITDAIRNGFLPREHQWKVISRYTEQNFPASTPPTLGPRFPQFDAPPRRPKDSDK